VSVVAYPFWQALDKAENGAKYVSGFVVAYDASRKEAQRLRDEIAELTPRIADYDAVTAENRRLRRMLAFERVQPGLSLLPAEVISVPDKPLSVETISNTSGVLIINVKIISSTSGVLIINRGSLHGVKEAMCAMTPDGVVGIVTKVEPVLSYVATLRSDLCKIGAMIGRDHRVQATVHGSGSDYSHICRMEYLDAKEVVRVGDEVLTRGSGIFPSEYPIGRIVDIDKTGSLFQVAYVEPAADPYAIDELFLVARAQPRLTELIGTSAVGRGTPAAEPADRMAYTMPDTRSVQDRFAP
jgi:cell shape-determining protein MreC